MGSASAADLVQAVEKAGYGAEAIEDDAERRERQQENGCRHHEALPLAGDRRPAGRYSGDGVGHDG